MPMLITIASMDRKAGATHLALSLSAKATTRGQRCGLIVSAECFEALQQFYVVVPQNSQESQRRIARMGELTLMSGVLPGEVSGLDVLTWDLGLYAHSTRSFAKGDTRLLVSGGQPWELGPLSELLRQLPWEACEGLCLCLRGIDAATHDWLKGQLASRVKSVAVQHKCDWTDTRLRDDLAQLLEMALS
jgi:hypothetical protein